MVKKVNILFRILILSLFFIYGLTLQAHDSPHKNYNPAIDSLFISLVTAEGERRVDLLNALAWEYRGEKALRSLEYGQLALSLARQLSYEKGETTALSYIGVAWRNLGHLSKALEYYYEALQLAEKRGERDRIAYSLINIGNILIYQDKHEEALVYFKRGLMIAEELKHDRSSAYAHINIGRVYRKLNQYNESLSAYLKSLQIRTTLDDLRGIATSCYEIGDVLTQLNRYNEARDYLIKAIAICEEYHFTDELGYALLNMSSVEFRSGNYIKAIEFSTKALTKGQQVGNRELKRDSYKTLSDAYAKQGDYRRAYEAHQEFMSSKDTLFNDETRRRTAELQAQYQIEKERARYEILQREKENQIQFRNSFIFISILLILLILTLIYRIRERRKASMLLEARNNELEKQKNLAEEANRFKSELVGIVAHDLRSPLNSILGFAQLLSEKHPDDDTVYTERQQTEKFISAIEHASRRMLKLIDDLLNITAIDSGKIQLNPVPLDIAKFVEECVIELASSAAQKGQSITFLANAYPIGEVDKERLREVLENIIGNAIKYSPYGKPIEVELSVAPSIDRPESFRIQVKDEGQGLSDSDKARLFKRFERLSSRPTGGESSNGLGLSISKHFVDLHGGKIWAESEGKLKGTSFFVEIPIVGRPEIVARPV